MVSFFALSIPTVAVLVVGVLTYVYHLLARSPRSY